jgi:Lon protease-like protein
MIGAVGEPAPIELPIFELPLAIVPAEQVPLHIFEERYRAMIGTCLDESSAFGIVLNDDAGPRTVGCTALVSDVIERYDDGRMDIICRGGSVFEVVDRFEAAEWPAASVTLIDEESPSAEEDVAEELGAARAAFAELLEAVGAAPARAEAAPDAFSIAAQIELPAHEKQRLLEERAERERLTLLEGSLRRLLVGLKRSRVIAERAKSNGHGSGRIGPVDPGGDEES